MYLAVDHPDDVLLGVAFAVAIPVTAFRWFTPNEVFPVVYRRGKTAHVDVTGRRGEAIRTAVHDQLGLTVLEIKPVGLESSASSTPLRLRVEGGPDEYLFAKLYTKGHVRADRGYKLWRTILYGSLEDEHPFQTVRRLAEYEDYALLLLQKVGIRTAKPYGIVEITPQREYLLVTEFFTGAAEIGEAVIDDGVIDQGLLLVRKLWDAGIAHRDIKPGNLMVRDGELLLIDVGLVQVRPSPWRQAVDLGNMMLVLAVRTDPERVYRRALRYFTPDELAEAFAATRGMASPTQLRAFMKRDPRDLLGEFRALAPPRGSRSCCSAGASGGSAWPPRCSVASPWPSSSASRRSSRRPNMGAYPPQCGTGHSMILAAQAVPSAALVPCVAALPAGWQVGGADIASGHARFWLDSDQAGAGAVTITLSATCDASGARQITVRPAGDAAVRAPAEPAPAVHRPALLHLPRRLRHLPVQFRARQVPPPRDPDPTARWPSCPGPGSWTTSGAPRAWRCAGGVRHARDEPARGRGTAGAPARRPRTGPHLTGAHLAAAVSAPAPSGSAPNLSTVASCYCNAAHGRNVASR